MNSEGEKIWSVEDIAGKFGQFPDGKQDLTWTIQDCVTLFKRETDRHLLDWVKGDFFVSQVNITPNLDLGENMALLAMARTEGEDLIRLCLKNLETNKLTVVISSPEFLTIECDHTLTPKEQKDYGINPITQAPLTLPYFVITTYGPA